MSFKRIKLNDGRSIPGIGFGTWKIGSGETVVRQVDQAINIGFDHFDTAQAYGNEEETGDALYLSDLSRDDLWVTTKYSGSDPSLSIYESCKASLEKARISSPAVLTLVQTSFLIISASIEIRRPLSHPLSAPLQR